MPRFPVPHAREPLSGPDAVTMGPLVIDPEASPVTEEETFELVVTPGEAGERLDCFLARRLGGLPRGRSAEIIRTRMVGGPHKPGRRVQAGQPFRLRLRVRHRTEPDFDLAVVHEEPGFVVVNKPAGQLVHPPRRGVVNTLVDHLERRFGGGVRFPHRLDRETSGILVAARSEEAARRLSRLFQNRRVEKTYLAVVDGHPTPPEGTLDLPLGKDTGSRVNDRQRVDYERGRPASTRYRTVQRTGNRSLVELFPRTGRLHQIRVHLAALGTPVVGDKIYGPDEELFLRFIREGFTPELQAKLAIPRHALHAAALRFKHPETHRPVEFRAPLPADMEGLLT